MSTWIIWLDTQGKWHAYRYSWGMDSSLDNGARAGARDFAEHPEKMAAINYPIPILAYCVHAPTRSNAISLVKQAEKRRRIGLTTLVK